MTTDWGSDAPLHEQIANLIRDEIANGKLAPGMTLPPEKVLAATYGVGLDVIRSTLHMLRRERLLEVRPGQGTQVRQTGEHHPVTLLPGDEAIARMPSLREQREMNLDDGVPVIEIRSAGCVTDVLPASEVALQVA